MTEENRLEKLNKTEKEFEKNNYKYNKDKDCFFNKENMTIVSAEYAIKNGYMKVFSEKSNQPRFFFLNPLPENIASVLLGSLVTWSQTND